MPVIVYRYWIHLHIHWSLLHGNWLLKHLWLFALRLLGCYGHGRFQEVWNASAVAVCRPTGFLRNFRMFMCEIARLTIRYAQLFSILVASPLTLIRSFFTRAGPRWGLRLQILNRYQQSLDWIHPWWYIIFHSAVARSISNWFELLCV